MQSEHANWIPSTSRNLLKDRISLLQKNPVHMQPQDTETVPIIFSGRLALPFLGDAAGCDTGSSMVGTSFMLIL